MRVAVTGASGLIGSRLVAALRERGDEVAEISRSANWRDPESEPAPAELLSGRDAVVHLAGEPVAQRWGPAAMRRIERSRDLGTANLVGGIQAASPRPRALVSASGVGYYGPRGDERLDESAPPGDDFLARVCVKWEEEARRAESLGLRVACMRTGVVLARRGGALAKMLPFFRLGIGGPLAGGRQYLPWIHIDDVVGMYVRAVDDELWRGPINVTAPEPVTNREFSMALGHVLKRPAVAPVPGLAVHVLYGQMAEIVTTGQRAVPKRAQELGYAFRFEELKPALADALRR